MSANLLVFNLRNTNFKNLNTVKTIIFLKCQSNIKGQRVLNIVNISAIMLLILFKSMLMVNTKHKKVTLYEYSTQLHNINNDNSERRQYNNLHTLLL